MVYLDRYSISADGDVLVEIAACECERTAARLEGQGYRRCTYAQFRAAWQARDARTLMQIRVEEERAVPSLVREVGGPPPPVGFTLYKV